MGECLDKIILCIGIGFKESYLVIEIKCFTWKPFAYATQCNFLRGGLR